MSWVNTGNKISINKRGRLKRLFLSIIGCIIGVVFVFPIYILALNSFKTQKGLLVNLLGFPDSKTFSPNNYAEAFDKLRYLQAFCNSLYITVCSVFMILLIYTNNNN